MQQRLPAFGPRLGHGSGSFRGPITHFCILMTMGYNGAQKTCRTCQREDRNLQGPARTADVFGCRATQSSTPKTFDQHSQQYDNITI